MGGKRIIRICFFLSAAFVLLNVPAARPSHAAGVILNSITLSDPDSGSIEYTNNSSIKVALNVSGSPAQMILSKYSDFRDASWAAYANPAVFSFEVPTLNGTRTVYCKLRNSALEESNIAEDSISMDTFRPEISASCSGPLNMTHVDMMFSDIIIVGADNPANYTITGGITVTAAQFVWVPSANLYKYRLSTSPQAPGTRYIITASANLKDLAGNPINPNARTFTYTASGASDTAKPSVNSLSIQNGAEYTNSRQVNISIAESDQGGLVAKWLITTTIYSPSQDAFTLTSRPSSYILSEGDGVKALYGWVMDDSGNISNYNPSASGSIILDQTPPMAEAGSDKSADAGEEVTFDGSGSSDNCRINRYIWDFGDGSPAVEGVTAAHAYAANGNYTVTLTVYDTAGNEANDIAAVTIGAPSNPAYLKVRGPNPDYNTITEAMSHIAEGGTIYVYPDEYCENVHMKEGVILKGDDKDTVILKGKIFFEETGGTVDGFTILFNEEEMITFTNANYPELKLSADSGITIINSSPTIKNCVIRPDLDLINWQAGYNPPLEHYGKAIQIWNMYGSPLIAPLIENNIILNNDCGIYYFNQAFAGEITGRINHNTLYNNNNGIILRMHKENPEVKNSIIYGNSGSSNNSGIFITYEDGALFNTRKSKMHHNDVFEHAHNYWLDQPGAAFDLTTLNGNISEPPLFIDAPNGYFGLASGSPCMGRADDGTNMGAIMEDNPLPPRPTIDPLPSLTNEQYINISGTKAASTSIWINDVEIIPLDEQTTWLAEYYNLGADGEKTLSVAARNAGGEGSPAAIAALTLDSKKPVVRITSPENNSTVASTPVTVTGTIDEPAAVTVNGIPAAVTGNFFTVNIPLTIGHNLITAAAVDPATNVSLPDCVIAGLNTSLPVITNFTPLENTELVEGSTITVTVNASDTDSQDLWYRFFVKSLLRQNWAKGRNTFDYYVSQAEVGLSNISVDVADSDPSAPITPNIVSRSSRIYNFRKPILPQALE